MFSVHISLFSHVTVLIFLIFMSNNGSEVSYAIRWIYVYLTDAENQPEELNKKAVTIINRVRDKLTGN